MMYLLYKEARMYRTACALALMVSAVVGSGCVDEARIFYIRQNQVPTTGCQHGLACRFDVIHGEGDVPETGAIGGRRWVR